MDKNTIYWFRQDLRLYDNPGLFYASQKSNLLPIYILDSENTKLYRPGEASCCWLNHSLLSLQKSLNNNLVIAEGDPLEILKSLVEKYGINQIYWNRCYEPWRIKRDKIIKKYFEDNGVTVKTYNGSLLWEPWDICNNNGDNYKVFTPFYRRGCLQSTPPRSPLPAPKDINFINHQSNNEVDSLKLLPNRDWGNKLLSHWEMGEEHAHARLNNFLKFGISNYKKGRDFPALHHTSSLSPHLHFGEISPNTIWYAALEIGDNDNIDSFCSELGWREFSYSQLYFNKDLAKVNIQSKFDNFRWNSSEDKLQAWKFGNTGIPFVDAGMRQLRQTGYIHNRVRMVVGSFLVKNLLLDWRHGERWFWNCLVDADLASNSAGWQWVAGCGADAAPYFRIFNPVTQGKKFDPDGDYIKKYLPELSNLPLKYIFSPWEAPREVLKKANIKLGVDYPSPIVDLKQSRELALERFNELKNQIT